ncbi:MAG: YbaB/EbfC family nucleoid-associated protein [Planctomycetota bacterium]
MFKELGAIASMVKQAKTMGPKMQAKMEEVASQRVTGTAGGGMVTVEANGASQVLSVSIDPSLAEKNDIEMITDLLPIAINDAIAKSKKLHMDAMQSVTGDLPMPSGMEEMLGKFLGGAGEGPTPGPPNAPPTA